MACLGYGKNHSGSLKRGVIILHPLAGPQLLRFRHLPEGLVCALWGLSEPVPWGPYPKTRQAVENSV